MTGANIAITPYFPASHAALFWHYRLFFGAGMSDGFQVSQTGHLSCLNKCQRYVNGVNYRVFCPKAASWSWVVSMPDKPANAVVRSKFRDIIVGCQQGNGGLAECEFRLKIDKGFLFVKRV